MIDPVQRAADAALRGEAVVLPTDTVYGVGTRPDDAAATARLFALKGRPEDLELPVLVPSAVAARTVAEFDERASALAARFWAGPLTLVLPRTETSRGWELGGDEETIGVRMPHHTLALAVLVRTGPLAVKDERPDATVYATDRSTEALELAASNAKRLGLDVHVLEGDLLSPLPEELRGWVDLVVSNPPYLTPDEYEDLPPEVKADPELALLGGPDVYERLAAEALRWLRDGGVLAVETGASQGRTLADALSGSFMDVRVEPDLAGRDRIVLGRRP